MWYFQQIHDGSQWRWKVFHLWKGVDSSWNLIPWTVIWIWYYNVTMVRMLPLTLILALALSSPDFLPMHYFIQIKPYIPSPKGMKKYFCLKKKGIVDNKKNRFEANMMILATMCNFTILGVGVTIMDINQNVSIKMHLEYLLHAV